jgi:hypothetical protein
VGVKRRCVGVKGSEWRGVRICRVKGSGVRVRGDEWE